MKKLFIYGLISAVLVSLLIIPASAAGTINSQYGVPLDFMKGNDPAYWNTHLDIFVNTSNSTINTKYKANSGYFQDLSTGEWHTNPAWITFPEDYSNVLFQTVPVVGRHDATIQIASNLFYLPYSPSAIMSMACGGGVRVPGAQADKVNVTCIARFYFEDKTYTDFRGFGVRGTSETFSCQFYTDNVAITASDISIPAEAVAFRFFIEVSADNLDSGEFISVTDVGMDCEYTWSGSMLSLYEQTGEYKSNFDEFGNKITTNQDYNADKVIGTIVGTIVDIFNPSGSIGSQIWVPDVKDLNESLNSSESTLSSNIIAWIGAFSNLLDPDQYQEFFITYLSGFSLLATMFAYVLQISFVNDLIQIALLVGFIALLINIGPSVTRSIHEPNRYSKSPPSYESYKARRDLYSSYSARYNRERGGRK